MSDASLEKLAILGGPKACDFSWPAWPIHDTNEERGILGVLKSGKWWFGEKVDQFEREFASFQGAMFAVSCTNGTTAIEMALRGLGVVEGDEVIVPPYSFIATASAVVTIGAIPVFADISPDSLCLDPADVLRRITPRTKAIIPVHVSGLISDIDQINQIARDHNLVVMEDAAHAWGSQLDGRGAGTFGGCGTFSFQETKNITAGEGGVIVTDDQALADLCRSFSHCGRTPDSAWYDHDLLGSNLRMTEFQAAILIAQLQRLPSQIETRRRNAQLLDEALGEITGISALAAAPRMTRRSYHMYIFRVDASKLGASRDQLVDALVAEGVPALAGWYRPLYKNGLFQNAHLGPAHGIKAPLADKDVDYTGTFCPVCEQVCQDAVWIPQNVLLSDESRITSLVNSIRKVTTQVRNGGVQW